MAMILCSPLNFKPSFPMLVRRRIYETIPPPPPLVTKYSLAHTFMYETADDHGARKECLVEQVTVCQNQEGSRRGAQYTDEKRSDSHQR